MSETRSLVAVAGLLGRLLIREVDEDLAAYLLESDARDCLLALGLDVARLQRGNLEELAADYFEAVVNPQDHPPLVQSLCEDGRYESAAAAAVRQIAEAAGLELDRGLARGAPPDHLGVELLLWAELAERSPDAREFVRRHLLWAREPLQAMAARGGFYGGVAAVVARFIGLAADLETDPRRVP